MLTGTKLKVYGATVKKAIVWNRFGKEPNTPYRNIPLVSGDYPTQEELKNIFAYNKDTGKLHWKFRTKSSFSSPAAMHSFAKRLGGKVAQTSIKEGVPSIVLSGKVYTTKTLVWIYHKGDRPTSRIICIDGDKMNTRIENLQLIS
jgi:outer membrane protein assembly factor BamB